MPNENAAFFTRNRLAQGRKPSLQDVDDEGNVRSPFEGLDNQAKIAASRQQRVSSRGLYAPGTTRGGLPRRRILGVDATQAAQIKSQWEHRNDRFFADARAVREADPSRPHQTPAQRQAADQAELPDKPAPTPAALRTVSVAAAGQDEGGDAAKAPPRTTPVRLYSPPAKTQDDTPAPQPGYDLPTPAGVDPVRTSKKVAASPFANMRRSNDPALAARINRERAGQGVDATGLPRKRKAVADTDNDADSEPDNDEDDSNIS